MRTISGSTSPEASPADKSIHEQVEKSGRGDGEWRHRHCFTRWTPVTPSQHHREQRTRADGAPCGYVQLQRAVARVTHPSEQQLSGQHQHPASEHHSSEGDPPTRFARWAADFLRIISHESTIRVARTSVIHHHSRTLHQASWFASHLHWIVPYARPQEIHVETLSSTTGHSQRDRKPPLWVRAIAAPHARTCGARGFCLHCAERQRG